MRFTDYTNRWPYRRAVAVDNTGGSATATDITFSVPRDDELFWTTVNQTDGRDIRVVDADGATLLTYKLTGFDVATRTVTIDVDGYGMPAAAMCQVWLYWGATGVSSAASVFAAAGAKTGNVLACEPFGTIVPAVREGFRKLRPTPTLQKATGESVFVSFDMRRALTNKPAGQPFGGGLEYAEVDYVSYRVTTAGGPVGAMIDVTKTRFFDGFVSVYVTGGTVDTEYTIELTVTTTDGQTQLFFAWLTVRNPDEA